MLRNIFVLSIIAIGIFYAAQGPFYALLFYLWNAYFRPEYWVWSTLIGQLNLSLFIGLYLVAITALSVPNLRINLRTGPHRHPGQRSTPLPPDPARHRLLAGLRVREAGMGADAPQPGRAEQQHRLIAG
jgi:hypothetical protein